MTQEFDVIVSGAGPAGAAAAWRAASGGARVLLCDRADFPRDKPCGDALTPRAVKIVTEMNLHGGLHGFHRVDRVRIQSAAGAVTRGWPTRAGLPGFGLVAPRRDLDHRLVETAAAAGAVVRQRTNVLGAIWEDGAVRGVRLRNGDRTEESVYAPITIAADGMSSRLARSVGISSRPDCPSGIAMRAEFESDRPEDSTLEGHATLRDGRNLIPGYGWVFPMGGGRINVGVGYLTSYKDWRSVSANGLLDQFMATLPKEWHLPSLGELRARGAVAGWRLPMGLDSTSCWRPGLVIVGDAAGAAKPFTGVGISKALQTGLLGASASLDALGFGSPLDLSAYEAELARSWGGFYRLGRVFMRVIGRPQAYSAIVNAGVRVDPVASFLLALFTGNGDEYAVRGVSGLMASGASSAAAIGRPGTRRGRRASEGG